jgi:sugar/nucleoside kinase (ribokinase family)
VKNTISVVGSTTIDTIIRQDKKVYKIGGVTTYAGFTFQNLGIKTIVISNIAKADSTILAGDVFFGAYIVSRLYNKMNIQDSCKFAAYLASAQICGNYIPFDFLKISFR